jgi:CHAT domain-containing protein
MQINRIVLIEYFCTEDVTLVFGVRAEWDEPKVEEVQVSLADLRAFVVEHFGVETTRERATASSVYEKVKQLDVAAFDKFFAPFIAPIREWAQPDEMLWLVPHDVLHYVPLHALHLDSEYLIARHPIFYTPSASVMKYCQAKRTNRPRLHALVLGDAKDNLFFARQEAQMVAKLFQTQPYLGGAATKEMFKARVAEDKATLDVLHLACHGEFNSIQPLRSGIVLAKNGTDDALTAEEIFGMEFNADLVVLSACESGVNERRPGDELIGLTRALIYAGTPSVLVTLWQVDDLSTLLLMERFYAELAHSASKAQALQRAQLALVNMTRAEILREIGTRHDALMPQGQEQAAQQFEEEAFESVFSAEKYNPLPQDKSEWHPFAHPASWAPFVLVGDWK